MYMLFLIFIALVVFHYWLQRKRLLSFLLERQQYNDHIKVLKNQLAEAETKLMGYFKKFSQIQVNFFALISYSFEAIGAAMLKNRFFPL